MAYNEIPLPVKLHPALDQSVIVSSILLHRTTHIYTTDEDDIIFIQYYKRRQPTCVTPPLPQKITRFYML